MLQTQTQSGLGRMGRSSKKKLLTQTVEEYASCTSIHGITYIFDRQPRFIVSELVAIDSSQGAHFCGSVLLGSDRALLPCHHHSPHLEHLDPVAGAAGEYI